MNKQAEDQYRAFTTKLTNKADQLTKKVESLKASLVHHKKLLSKESQKLDAAQAEVASLRKYSSDRLDHSVRMNKALGECQKLVERLRASPDAGRDHDLKSMYADVFYTNVINGAPLEGEAENLFKAIRKLKEQG